MLCEQLFYHSLYSINADGIIIVHLGVGAEFIPVA